MTTRTPRRQTSEQPTGQGAESDVALDGAADDGLGMGIWFRFGSSIAAKRGGADVRDNPGESLHPTRSHTTPKRGFPNVYACVRRVCARLWKIFVCGCVCVCVLADITAASLDQALKAEELDSAWHTANASRPVGNDTCF